MQYKNDVHKKIAYYELVKKVNAIQSTCVSKLVKKADCDTKIVEIEKKILDHDNYITTEDFNKLTYKNFGERLKQKDLAIKNGIADFVKDTNFGERLRKISDNVTSNKARFVETENKLTDPINSYTKLINDPSREVKLITTTESSKDLINEYSIFNGAKYLFGLQNYFVF